MSKWMWKLCRCCISYFISPSHIYITRMLYQLASYLLEASLNQVLRKEVSDKVKKGIQTGNLIILSSFSEILLEFWISRVDEEHQDHAQHSSNDSSGHVIDHGSGTQATTWLRIQTSQTLVGEMSCHCFIFTSSNVLIYSFYHSSLAQSALMHCYESSHRVKIFKHPFYDS